MKVEAAGPGAGQGLAAGRAGVELGQAIEAMAERFARRVSGQDASGRRPSPTSFAEAAAEELAVLLESDWGMEALGGLLRGPLAVQDRVNPHFGEPAVTLFHHADFRLDALCWRHGATSIHHHNFSGAFGLFAGTSLHRTLCFAGVEATDSPHVELLSGCHEEVDVLSRGHVCRIEEGPGFAHQVTHLESPAVTLVLRSHESLSGVEEWSYLPPTLRVASRPGVPAADQQARFFRFWRSFDAESALEFATSLLSVDSYTDLEILRVLAQADRDFESTRSLAELIPAGRSLVGAVIAEASRERVAAAMRRVREKQAHLVLGVLCTAAEPSSRHRLLIELGIAQPAAVTATMLTRCLGEGVPGDPEDFALRLADALDARWQGQDIETCPKVASVLRHAGLAPCILDGPEVRGPKSLPTA